MAPLRCDPAPAYQDEVRRDEKETAVRQGDGLPEPVVAAQRDAPPRKVCAGRVMLVVLSLLATMSLASVLRPHAFGFSRCHGADAVSMDTNVGDAGAEGMSLVALLQDADSRAIAAVHGANEALAKSFLTLGKRQDANSSSSAATTPATTPSSTPATTPNTTPSTPADTTPATTLGSTTPAETTPGNTAPTTPASTTIATGTKQTTATLPSSSKSAKVTTLTSTNPDGNVVTLTQTSFVDAPAATTGPEATATKATPSLQDAGVSLRRDGALLLGAFGVVLALLM